MELYKEGLKKFPPGPLCTTDHARIVPMRRYASFSRADCDESNNRMLIINKLMIMMIIIIIVIIIIILLMNCH